MTVLNLNGNDTYLADPHWDNVDLYLRDSIEDLSKNSRALGIFPSANSVVRSSVQGALYFSGDGYLTVGVTPVYLASETFTVDFWFKVPDNTTTHYGILNADTDGFIDSNIAIRIYSSNDHLVSTSYIAVWHDGVYGNATCQIIKGQWHHVAIIKEPFYDAGLFEWKNNYKFYLDGEYLGSRSYPNADVRIQGWIGRVTESASYTYKFSNAYLKHFRVTRGIARFTANFDPQSLFDLQPLTALYYGNTLVEKLYKGDVQLYPAPIPFSAYTRTYLTFDNGADGATSYTPILPDILNGTINLNGWKVRSSASKYGSFGVKQEVNYKPLIITPTDFDASGNFTVEFWGYFGNNQFVGSERSLITWGTPTKSQGFSINNDDTTLKYRFIRSGLYSHDATISNWFDRFPQNQWNHIAVTQDATNFYFFLNGTLIVTYAKVDMSFTGDIKICDGWTQQSSTLYIDSIRITDECRYTTSFNPETDTYLAY